MHNLKIKVCGITREKDAKSALKYGADMLGFIFYKKSSRYVSVRSAKNIVSSIPPTALRVGVFVNEEKEKVLRVAQKLLLDFIQLSGNEKKSDITFLSKHGFKIIKTIAVKSQSDILKAEKLKVDIIHLDNADKNEYGGSGKKFDWNIKIPIRMKNVMLAGGINTENVLKGIKRYNPLIVDLNSGVETKPGVKSDKLLKEFFSKVNKIRYGS